MEIDRRRLHFSTNAAHEVPFFSPLSPPVIQSFRLTAVLRYEDHPFYRRWCLIRSVRVRLCCPLSRRFLLFRAPTEPDIVPVTFS